MERVIKEMTAKIQEAKKRVVASYDLFTFTRRSLELLQCSTTGGGGNGTSVSSLAEWGN